MNKIYYLDNIRSLVMKNYLRKINFEYRKATWQLRPLPDFLVIGAQRSGTSSLYWGLNQHPDIYSSPIKNEIHFFDGLSGKSELDNFLEGIPWYRAHFPREREMHKQTRLFDSTPLYLFHPLAPERIFNLLPDIKLIAILRNPIERAISHYFMIKRKNREPMSILEAMHQEETRLEKPTNEKDYLNRSYVDYSYKSRGRYAEQLERYFQFFPTQNVLLLSSEDFFSDYHKTLRKVFDFVGVNPGFIGNDLPAINAGRNKTEIPQEVKEYLADYFKSYNQAFIDLTGKDFGWQ